MSHQSTGSSTVHFITSLSRRVFQLPAALSRGARRQEKGIEGGGDQSHRSLSPSANCPAQLGEPTHPPQARRPHPHCAPTRRDVPRAVAAPSPALLVSKSTAVDSVTTWVLRLSRDGHIGSLLGLCGTALPFVRADPRVESFEKLAVGALFLLLFLVLSFLRVGLEFAGRGAAALKACWAQGLGIGGRAQ